MSTLTNCRPAGLTRACANTTRNSRDDRDDRDDRPNRENPDEPDRPNRENPDDPANSEHVDEDTIPSRYRLVMRAHFNSSCRQPSSAAPSQRSSFIRLGHVIVTICPRHQPLPTGQLDGRRRCAEPFRSAKCCRPIRSGPMRPSNRW